MIDLAGASASVRRQIAKQELHRRSELVRKAIELLARLQVVLNRPGLGSGKNPLSSRSAELKVAMAYLLDEDALQCLLEELEAALEASESSMEPDAYRQAALVYQGAAGLLESGVMPELGQTV